MQPQDCSDDNLQPCPRLTHVMDEFTEFTYRVSHDLGAPLRAVVHFTQLLSENYSDFLDERGLAYLGFITEGGQKAQAMLIGLTQYSRLTTRAQPFALLDTATAVEQAHSVLKDKIHASHARIKTDTLPTIVADSAQLCLLFAVLIDNAITYQKPGNIPQILISYEDCNTCWKFNVEDNGIGIDPNQHKNIFEIFQRLHTDSEYHGVGMGLAMAKKIMLRHQGDIGFSPSQKGGTIFWFTIPKFTEKSSLGIIEKDSKYG